MYDTGLTRQAEQKILIQVDTVPQHFDYVPDKPILNKFEVFTQINVVPKNILLAQKNIAATNRKRAKGRDFFDIIFLYGLGARPDWGYLRKNLGVESQPQLRAYLLEKTQAFELLRTGTGCGAVSVRRAGEKQGAAVPAVFGADGVRLALSIQQGRVDLWYTLSSGFPTDRSQLKMVRDVIGHEVGRKELWRIILYTTALT